MSEFVRATLSWVEQFVIGLRLCPFAARPFYAGRVTVRVCPHAEHEAQFIWAGTQVQSLIQTPPQRVETTLLVFAEGLASFDEFMGMVGALEGFLSESGADALVQLAHFHPDYVFADVAADDPGNATNRSPYPTIQLLRVASVAEVVEGYPDVDRIPLRNIALLRSLHDEGSAADAPLGGDDQAV